ncbi:ABC transporter family substrate-binding protein [Naumannella sp. ID2617S]|nr:ABC transporter family substrate-binding protein [Naumannella sp. ID2617S]
MKFRRILAVPVVVGLLVTGCSKPEDKGESNTTPLPASDVNPQDRAALQPGGEVRLASESIGNLNPMSADAAPGLDSFRRAVLPQFFSYDEHGVATPNTAFLESATETSSNPTVVTLKFNQRATWGDGQPLSANDLIATWQACNGRSAGFRCNSGLRFNQIREVTAGASQQEAQVTFNKAYPDWRGVFERVSMLRAESVRDANTFNAGWTTWRKEWMSGPFAVDQYDQAQKVLVATPNSTWWGEKPLLDRLTIREIPRENQARAYANQEIDLLDLSTSPELYKAAKTVPDHQVRRAAATSWRQLVLNTASTGPVSEPAVRKAVALTLNRSRIGSQALPGIEFNAAPLGNRVFLTGQDGYVDNAARLELTRDLDAARSVLDKAGWKEKDGTRSKDGRALQVNLVQVRGVAAAEAEAAAIAEQLKAVGFQVQLSDASLADFDNGSVLSGGRFDLITMGGQGSRHPFGELSDRFGSGTDQNYSRLENPEIDQLLEQIAAEPALPRRVELANQLDGKLWETLPTIPLYQQPQSVGASLRLANLGAQGLASISWEKVGYLK